MRTLRWASRAQADLARLDRYYRPLSAEFAQGALLAVLRAGEFLCEYPQAGPVTRRRGLRKWQVAGTPFLLLYRFTAAELRVTRVAHGAQDWDRW